MRLIYTSLITLCLAGSAIANTGLTFPTLSHEDLNERMVQLPSQLPGDPSIVFVAYKQNQQSEVNTWLAGLGLKARNPKYEFVELPVVGSGAKIMKSTIDNGMRSGIVDPDMRARTITVYSSRSAFNAALDISSRNSIYALVVTRSGEVLAKVEGPYDTTKAKIILDSLGASN